MSDWRHQAACLDEDPELFFPIGNTGPAVLQTEEAKKICRRCDVVETCLRYALDTGQDAGVWGGLSEEERRALKRRVARSTRTGAASSAALVAAIEAAAPASGPRTAADALAEKRRRGQGTRGRMVPAEPVVDLLAQSRLASLSNTRLAALTRVDRESLRQLRNGERSVITSVTESRIRAAVSASRAAVAS